MKKPNGVILFEGPSALDNKPIVVVATLSSKNAKTGDMVQTWILRQDLHPLMARQSGEDYSICGNCPHRSGSCYVNIGQAPAAVWRAYTRGSYPAYDPRAHDKYLAGRGIRFGAYGDPAAAPWTTWRNLARLASTHTGYTHQWAHANYDERISRFVMLSADSPKQADKAETINPGARTFRVMNAGDTLRHGEIECLSDSKGMQCLDCGLCDGKREGSAVSIAITVHGAGASKFNTANVIARG
jgi:hypothetical protein